MGNKRGGTRKKQCTGQRSNRDITDEVKQRSRSKNPRVLLGEPLLILTACLEKFDVVIDRAPFWPSTWDRQKAWATIIKYEGLYRSMWKFCLDQGYFESMGILLEKCPKNCLPMKPAHVLEFMTSKIQSDEWISPDCWIGFSAAISTLHTERGHNAAFSEGCPSCKHLFTTEKSRDGCIQHPNAASLSRHINTMMMMEQA